MIMEPTSGHSPTSAPKQYAKDDLNVQQRYVKSLSEGVAAKAKPIIDASMLKAAAYLDLAYTLKDSDGVQRSMRNTTNIEEGLKDPILAPKTDKTSRKTLHNRDFQHQMKKFVHLGRR